MYHLLQDTFTNKHENNNQSFVPNLLNICTLSVALYSIVPFPSKAYASIHNLHYRTLQNQSDFSGKPFQVSIQLWSPVLFKLTLVCQTAFWTRLDYSWVYSASVFQIQDHPMMFNGYYWTIPALSWIISKYILTIYVQCC